MKMASTKNNKRKPLLLLLLFFLFFISTTPTTAITTESLDSLIFLLHSRTHTLFANAISTSDLLFDILSLPSLTLLAPPNPSLLSVDMTETPLSYLSTLRLHLIPSALNLLSLPNNASLHTLLPSRDLHVFRAQLDNNRIILRINGVQVVLPPLYRSKDVFVYRLRGILPSRYLSDSVFIPSRNRVNHTLVAPMSTKKPVLAPSPSPIKFPVPDAPTGALTSSNLTNSTDLSPVSINGTVPSASPPENSMAPSPAVALTVVSPMIAPDSVYGYSPENDTATNIVAVAALGENGGDLTPEIEAKDGKELEEYGPFDGNRMQSTVRDGHLNFGDVSA